MGFNEAVIHDLLVLEDAVIKAESDIKKLKRVNALQWIAIGYLLCKVGKNSDKEEVTIEEKVKEKCKKMFNKRHEK